MLIIFLIITSLFLVLILRNTYVLSPEKIFTYFWLIQLWGVVFLFGNIIILNESSIIYILFAILSFVLGASIVGNVERKRTYHVRVRDKHTYLLIFLITFLAFINPVLMILRNGFNLGMMLNISDLLELNNGMSIDRYAGEDNTSLLTQVLLVFTYLSPLCGGFFLKKIGAFSSIITIFPSIFTTLTQGIKMCLITSVILWVSGIFAYSLLMQEDIKVRFKTFFFAVIACLFFVGLLLLSMTFRIGRLDKETFSVVEDKFVVYSLGHIPAFGNWYDKYDYTIAEHTLGAKTFYGITNQLGILKREQGLFTEMVYVTKNGGVSNVYTIFRIFIEDFGMVGSLLWILVLGSISKFFYNCLKRRAHIYTSLIILLVFYFVIFWSFATCALAYTSYILMFILMYFILRYFISVSYAEV